MRLIFSRAHGLLTGEDLRSHQKRLLADEGFDPSYNQLWDFSDVKEIDLKRQTVGSLAQSRSFNSGAKRAIVAPQDVQFGLARMFQTLHDGAHEDLEVFRSLEKARLWLGLQVEETPEPDPR